MEDPASYRNPVALLGVVPGQPLPAEWRDLLPRLRKEWLAHFDLGSSPSLRIHGIDWTRSEVLGGLAQLQEQDQALNQWLWEQDWSDFWSGKPRLGRPFRAEDISSLADPAFWSALTHCIHRALARALEQGQSDWALTLLTHPWPLADSDRSYALEPLQHWFLRQSMTWLERNTALIGDSGPPEGYASWYPLPMVELMLRLPAEWSERSGSWARSVLRASKSLVRHLDKPSRLQLPWPEAANPHWSEDLQRDWRFFPTYRKNPEKYAGGRFGRRQTGALVAVVVAAFAIGWAIGWQDGGTKQPRWQFSPVGFPGMYIDSFRVGRDSARRAGWRYVDSVNIRNLERLQKSIDSLGALIDSTKL